MKKFTKLLVATNLVALLIVASFMRPAITLAATTPSLGAAETYGVLTNTYTNGAGTTINGDVGFTVPPTTVPLGTHTNYGSSPPYATAGADQSSARTALAVQPCTFTWGAAVDLFLDTTHGTPSVYTPGVYCSGGAMTVTGSITLNGSGTYIFRAAGSLDTTATTSVNLIGGASACDIFWTPEGATTLGASSSFAGTVIEDTADITMGASSTWTGRAIAFTGAVTTGAGDTITVPDCTPPPATLRVVKQVVNNDSGTAVAADFIMHVRQGGTDVTGSPSAGASAPGTPYTLPAGTYAVSEDANAAYTSTFSGDCDSSGNITLVPSDDMTCTITNDDIAPPVIVDPPPPQPPPVLPTPTNGGTGGSGGGSTSPFSDLVAARRSANSRLANTGHPTLLPAILASIFLISAGIITVLPRKHWRDYAK